MALKKQHFDPESEVPIFNNALVYVRDGHWQFRMYVAPEKKYVVRSLKTQNRSTAISKAEDMYHEILMEVKSGKKLFSITTKEAVAKYLDYRHKDIATGGIVVGRFTTITAHLNHFLDFIGRDTRMKELGVDDMEDYYGVRLGEKASQSTILNEQSTINAMMKWLYRCGNTSFESFIYRPVPKIDTRAEDIRKATITDDEYKALFKAGQSYVEGVEGEEYLERQIARHWIVINANCGMRNGEARQLKVSDTEILTMKADNDLDRILVKLTIRAETSKWRKSRTAVCRGGQYFERLKTILKSKNDDLVFSVDGATPFTEKLLLKHFYAICWLAKIKDFRERGISPYSLRHYMITERVRANLTVQSVADMCGTSIREIEGTYFHMFDDMRISNALMPSRKTKYT
jgi:integrase